MKLGEKGQDIPIQWVASPLGPTEIEEVEELSMKLRDEVVHWVFRSGSESWSTEGAAPGVKAVHPDPLVLVLVLVAEVAALEIEAVHLVLLVYLELDCEGGERLERLVDGE